eukprot:scaffold30660_cov101-Isochrysis_galbana.AAC.1
MRPFQPPIRPPEMLPGQSGIISRMTYADMAGEGSDGGNGAMAREGEMAASWGRGDGGAMAPRREGRWRRRLNGGGKTWRRQHDCWGKRWQHHGGEVAAAQWRAI